MRQVLPVVPAKHNPHYLIFKSCKSLGRLKQKFYSLLCTFWSVLQYNARMLFPSIETCTIMNAREFENYLPISRSFSASKQCQDFLGQDISGTTFFRAEIYRGRLLTNHNYWAILATLQITLYVDSRNNNILIPDPYH